MNSSYCLIINVRNGEDYISGCIESLLSQKYHRYKIYVFDNCSDDHTGSIVMGYIKLYPDLLVYCALPSFLPINEARNFALTYLLEAQDSKFDYFSFCDADDYWDANWLIEVDGCADGSAVVYTDGYEVFDDCKLSRVFVNHHQPKYSVFSSRVYLQGTVVPFSYVSPDSGFFDLNVEYTIDVDKWNELYLQGVAFKHIRTPLFYYRVHENSLSASGFGKVMRERWYLTGKYGLPKSLYLLKLSYYYAKVWLTRLNKCVE